MTSHKSKERLLLLVDNQLATCITIALIPHISFIMQVPNISTVFMFGNFEDATTSACVHQLEEQSTSIVLSTTNRGSFESYFFMQMGQKGKKAGDSCTWD